MKTYTLGVACALAAFSVAAQPLLTSSDCAAESSMRSSATTTAASVRFVNGYAEPVTIYWLDYEGSRVLYSVIDPGDGYVQSTFVTHPWVAADAQGKCLAVFLPEAGDRTAAISQGGSGGGLIVPSPGFPSTGGLIPGANVSGIYRIRAKASGRYLHEDSLLSTQTQPDPAMRFEISLSADAFRITVKSTGRFLHDDGNGDRLVSTRYQPDDDFARFYIERQSDGSYRFKSKGSGRYLHEDGSGDRLVSTRFERDELVPLVTYWNAEQSDFLSASTAASKGAASDAGYRRILDVEPSVYSTQRTGMVPLALYYSKDRSDYLLVSTAAGKNQAASAGYVFVRNEGFVYPIPHPGTAPLNLYYNAVRADYAIAAGVAFEEELIGLGYRFVRAEGYAVSEESFRFYLDPEMAPAPSGPQPSIRTVRNSKGYLEPGVLSVLTIDGASLDTITSAAITTPAGTLKLPAQALTILSPARVLLVLTVPADSPGDFNGTITLTSALGRTATGRIPVLTNARLGPQSLGPQSIITTVAGGRQQFQGDGGPARAAAIAIPMGPATDKDGKVYVALRDHHLVVAIDPRTQELRVVAGNGIDGFSGDGGPAVRASLAYPRVAAFDGAGNLYVLDGVGTRVRKITPGDRQSIWDGGGRISTVAGNGLWEFSGDGGKATNASFSSGFHTPGGLAVDTAGNIYIADEANHRIRRVTTDGIIRTYAGTGRKGCSGDGGRAVNADLDEIQGLTVDTSGNLYVTGGLGWLVGRSSDRIRKIDASGNITTVLSGNPRSCALDGKLPRVVEGLDPRFTAAGRNGDLFINDGWGSIRKLAANDLLSNVAGTGEGAFAGDGRMASEARFNEITGMAVDPLGNLYIADGRNYRVRRVTPGGEVSTIAGNGQNSPITVSAGATQMAIPDGRIFVQANGDLLIADWWNHVVHRVSPNGSVERIAGTGVDGFSGDNGPADRAMLKRPTAVVADSNGNIYVNDSQNGRVRRIDRNRIITTLVEGLDQLEGLGIDRDGNLYIGSFARKLYKYSAGRLTAIAGTGVDGDSGDGGRAVEARMLTAFGIAISSRGEVYFADRYGPARFKSRVRVIGADGIIRTVAGGGNSYPQDDAIALNVNFDPVGLAIDPAGNLLISDQYSGSIFRLLANGRLQHIAGGGEHNGDGGPAYEARFNPGSMSLGPDGSLYFFDFEHFSVRKIAAVAPLNQSFRLPSEIRLTAPARSAPVSRTLIAAGGVEGMKFTTESISGSTGIPSWLKISPNSGTTPRAIDIIADPGNLNTRTAPYEGIAVVTLPGANPPSAAIRVSFQVQPPLPPSVGIDHKALTFAYPLAASARTETITVSNVGSGTLTFTVATAMRGGGTWLRTNAKSEETVQPGRPVSLVVTADPSGMRGTYSGTITISIKNGGTAVTIPVTMMVSRLRQSFLLTQRALAFRAVAGGGVVPKQKFGVLNLGNGSVSWSVSAPRYQNLKGNGWLTVSAPDTVSTQGRVVPEVELGVNIAGLDPGQYYALVDIRGGSEVANSPQSMPVFLDVLPAGSNPGAAITPSELVLTATRGINPSSENVFVYGVSAARKNFRVATTTDNAGWLLQVAPASGLIDPSQPSRVTVQAVIGNLPAGQYRGRVSIQFSDDGSVRDIPVLLLVTEAGAGGTSSSKSTSRALEGCTPKELIPAIQVQGGSTNVAANWPVSLEVAIIDNCGQPFTKGTAKGLMNGTYFKLESHGDGRWYGGPSGTVRDGTLTVEAKADGGWKGSGQIELKALSSLEKPHFESEDISIYGARKGGESLAPGAVIRIAGKGLTEGNADNGDSAWQTVAGGTRVFIGDRPMPIWKAGQEEILGQIPFDLEPDTPWRIYLTRGIVLSSALDLKIASAQPVITRIPTQAAPMSELKIQCAGLGALDLDGPPAAGDGNVRAKTKFPVNVSIGGVDIPGATAVYEGRGYTVTANVPDLPPGEAEVVVSVQVRFDSGTTQTVPSDPAKIEIIRP